MKYFFLTLLSAFLTGFPLQAEGQVQWLTSMQAYEALDSTVRTQKPVYIDLYTDWCSWCKVMDQKTFTHDSVAFYLNNYFIPVKLNAETRDSIIFRKVPFTFNEKIGLHNFVLYLIQTGNIGFPTAVVIEPALSPNAIPGYLEVKDMEKLLKYYAIPLAQRQPFKEFNKNFSNKWR